MVFVNSRQFNKDNFELVIFSDFCGYCCIIFEYFFFKIPHRLQTYFLENDSQGNMVCEVLFLEISHYQSSYPEGASITLKTKMPVILTQIQNLHKNLFIPRGYKEYNVIQFCVPQKNFQITTHWKEYKFF